MTHSTHAYLPDERNESILIDIDGELLPRAEARVSVFDSAFLLGDGVWEGLRVHNGRIAFLDRHLRRLYQGARTLDIAMPVDRDAMSARLYRLLKANSMTDDVHIRLVVSRGLKATPYQDPRATIGPPTIVMIPEYKKPLAATATTGKHLFTVHVRRGYSDVQDPKLNSLSKLNCIMACIQAAKAGADEALMLDPQGFVATCNSTHFFIVSNGEVWTSTGDYCLPGITRELVIELGRADGIDVRERNFSLSDVYGADEAFITGTFAGLTPVASVDGRTIGDGGDSMLARLQGLYRERVRRECGA